MSAKPLSESVVLITGSTRGIGWAAAQRFAAEGAIVVVNGCKQPELVEKRAQELTADYGIQAMPLCADFSDPQAIQAAYQSIYQLFKRVDVVVNNAGVMHTALLGMIEPGIVSASFNLNAIGLIHSLQCAARLMRRTGGGSIVNISSIVGRFGHRGQVVYGAAKAAVIGATVSASKELAADGIRVNCVAPGIIDTELLEGLSDAERQASLAQIGLGRMGTPAEVAEAIVFLASARASYITGQVLGIDGGMVI